MFTCTRQYRAGTPARRTSVRQRYAVAAQIAHALPVHLVPGRHTHRFHEATASPQHTPLRGPVAGLSGHPQRLQAMAPGQLHQQAATARGVTMPAARGAHAEAEVARETKPTGGVDAQTNGAQAAPGACVPHLEGVERRVSAYGIGGHGAGQHQDQLVILQPAGIAKNKTRRPRLVDRPHHVLARPRRDGSRGCAPPPRRRPTGGPRPAHPPC